MIQLLESLEKFVERASRPGVLGVVGRKLEKKAQRELVAYFQRLGQDIVALKLEERVPENVATARQMVIHSLHNVLRKLNPTLLLILKGNLEDAYVAAAKLDYAQQADYFKLTPQVQYPDKVGDTALKAAAWAEEHAGELITGLNATTQQKVADAVASGIENQLGVGGIASLIQNIVDDMTRARAITIASTEINDAMSAAAMDKMESIGIEYKQIVLSEDACPICEANASEDPVPIDHVYESGDDSPPFHPNCRCAITGARPPASE